MDRERALPVCGPEAVGAGVAAADDDDVLSLRGDSSFRGNGVPFALAILLRQVVHCEVDAVEIASRNGQVARPAGAAGEHDRVEVAAQRGDRHVDADVDAGPEDHPFHLHQRQAPIEVMLLQLELRDAVPHQAADAIGSLEHGYLVAGPIQLVRRREAGGARANHGDAAARPHGRRPWRYPALLERAIDDRALDGLDIHRIVVDSQHARALARRGTQAAGELREIVRRVQAIAGGAPLIARHQVVPVGDQVPERAALMAEGDAAVHAPGALLAQLRDRFPEVDLVPVVNAFRDRTRLRLCAPELDEAGRLTH